MNKCSTCGTDLTTKPHALDNDGNRYCYKCCAEQDKEQMRNENKIVLYLSGEHVTNWPGSLKIPVRYKKVGKHNMAGTRVDVWFVFEDREWHGTQYGHDSELCYCKKLNLKKQK